MKPQPRRDSARLTGVSESRSHPAMWPSGSDCETC